MEQARDIATVCAAYERGRITASKMRGHIESIVFDRLSASEIHPLDMGESTQAAVLAIVNRSRDPLSASGIATALGIPETRASQMLSRHAREGRIFRVRHGVYRSKP